MADTIRLEFYKDFCDLPAYDTLEAAMKDVPQSRFPYNYSGYAVLFELHGKYAVYVHNEDRYWSSYLPFDAKPKLGGWCGTGKPIAEWESIGKYSDEERRLIEEYGLPGLLDGLE